MARLTRPAQLSSLAARLHAMERLLREQGEELLTQREEIARLGAVAGGTPLAPHATDDTPADDGATQPARQTRQTRSRRALLKLGGAAAAAGVAAVAAGATDLAYPGTARANGVTWQTGVVNSDNVTFVEPSNGMFPDPTLLAVRVGTAAAYNGLSTANSAAIAGYDTTSGVVSSGVYGTSYNGYGIQGQCDSGVGVLGCAHSGEGVIGISTLSYGGVFNGGLAPIQLVPHPLTGAPTTGNHGPGEIYVDAASTLWVCIGPGMPGVWVRLTRVNSGAAGGAIHYLSTPVRLLDARSGASSGLVNRGALAGNEVYTFAVAGLGGSGIPSDAQGLIANVTVLGPSGAGNLSLFPAGGAVPTVASMTFGQPGLFLANGVNVAIGSGGAINIQNQSGGTTPLVLDAVAFVS
jgi:hypothetical protein